ncbi:MAG: hypothetical protein GY876_00905 [Planctomycetes bacterium]|nr:hypothetical protein [Planctomycetota bacterium]
MPQNRTILAHIVGSAWLPLTMILAFAATGQATAFAQPAPKSLAKFVKKTTMTPADKTSIGTFVDRYTADLAGDDASLHSTARQKLIMDLHGVAGNRATPFFRETYAEILLPKLKDILAKKSPPQSIASCQVAGELGTDSAVTFLSRHLTPEQEPHVGTRIWSAASLRPLINQSNVTPTRIVRVLRDLGRAASAETDWSVLRQQLVTLAAAIENTRSEEAGSAEVLDSGQATQAEVLYTVIQRLQNGDLDMLRVLEPQMQHVQQQFLDQRDPDTLLSFAKTTGPVLGRLYDAILANWEALAENEGAATLAGRMLNQGEVMIVLMNNEIAGGSATATPAYGQAISRGDRAPLEAGRERWGQGNGG